NEELVDYVVNHKNGWLRNVFRHYIQYLYYKRVITPELFGWLMEIVPSRGYKLDVRPYQIKLEDLLKTLRFLRENHETYYLVYRLMLESGARVSHALLLLSSWNPHEQVSVATIGLESERLVCFEEKGFCRYYLGIKSVQKPCEWVYMSTETADAISRTAPVSIDRSSIRKYAKRHGLLSPKTMRKLSWRFMVQTMPREVARFVQSRFGELGISEARYEDLLKSADEYYPRYLSTLISQYLMR
ncbi:MAG: integrase, partial [Nitrososphaerota archaeon]